jgi:hypothetical protein
MTHEEKRFELRGYYKSVYVGVYLTREEYAEYRKGMKIFATTVIKDMMGRIGTTFRDEAHLRETIHTTMAKRVKAMLLQQESDNKHFYRMESVDQATTWMGYIYLLLHLKEITNDGYNGWAVLDHEKGGRIH